MSKSKIMRRIGMLALCTTLLCACVSMPVQEETTMSEIISEETVSEAESTGASNLIADAIAQETAKVDTTPTQVNDEDDRVADAEVTVGVIPGKYIGLQLKERGTIEHITYTAHDYYGDGAEIEKEANVYLPYNYDATKQYNVLILCHGIGGDENEWGMTDNNSRVKLIMDNLIYNGDIEPFIVVTPNGRSAADHGPNSDYMSFYKFGEELRGDLLPYIDANYATYAEYDENGYDLSAARDHRAMAGLSMGGMQTINIGIGECLDCFSYFGAFSAAPTSNPAATTAELLKDNTYPIHYFYNICGTEDNVAYASSSTAAKNLPAVCDQFVEGENFLWQERKGGHDFNIWYLGFYNFAQIAFK